MQQACAARDVQGARGIIPLMSTRRSRFAGPMARRLRAATMGFIGLAVLIAGAPSARAQVAHSAAFVSQSVPSFITTGAITSVSVTMQNTGTATWYQAEGDVFLATQEPQDNYYWCIQDNVYGS